MDRIEFAKTATLYSDMEQLNTRIEPIHRSSNDLKNRREENRKEKLNARMRWSIVVDEDDGRRK